MEAEVVVMGRADAFGRAKGLPAAEWAWSEDVMRQAKHETAGHETAREALVGATYAVA